jgi:hypothetical protein
MSTRSRSLISRAAFALAVLTLAFPSGCQRVAPSGNTTVQGRVIYRGQPVSGGLVVFTPDLERGGSGKPIPAEIASDGRFQLPSGGETVIAPGWYRVAIASAPNPSSILANEHSVFPPQLARPDRSGLVREVKAGQENTFDFIIEPN